MDVQTRLTEKYYQSITDLPLCKYVDCLVDGDLSALVITGEPPVYLLDLAWHDIQQEYADASGDDEYKLYLILLKEVNEIDIDIKIAESCVMVLRCIYDEKIANLLNQVLTASFVFNWQDQGDYHKQLDRAAHKAKATRNINYELKLSELSAKDDRFGKGETKKPTREYFQSFLITLSDHAKFHITDAITVYQFCERIRRLHLYLEQIKAA